MERIQDTLGCSFSAANRIKIRENSCVSFSSDTFGCLRNSSPLVCRFLYYMELPFQLNLFSFTFLRITELIVRGFIHTQYTVNMYQR
jgi:hypothetical protein